MKKKPDEEIKGFYDEVGEVGRKEMIGWVKKYYYKNQSIRDVDDKALNKVISFAFQKGRKQATDEILKKIDDFKIIKLGNLTKDYDGSVVASKIGVLEEIKSKIKKEGNKQWNL